MPTAGPTETVHILRLAPGGHGVARRSNGEILFVAGTAPGDDVEIGSVKRTQGALHGELLRVVSGGADRREPPCPHAAECGGCDFMHITPDAQRREKISMLDQALDRIGGLRQRSTRIDFVAGGANSLRCRVRLHVDSAGRVGMLSARSHRVTPIQHCLVCDETINLAIRGLATLGSSDLKRLSFCEQIELRSSDHAPMLAARLFPRQGATLRAALYAPFFPSESVVVIAGSSEDDRLTQDYQVGDDVSIKVPLSAFAQVRPDVNRHLVRAVVRAVEVRGHETFLDAYAGAGNFTLPLLCAGLRGQAVDACAPAVLAARAVTRDLGLPFTGFDVGDARSMLEHYVRAKRHFDYIIVDPPRQGAKSALDVALRLTPRTLALVACDPVSLARDLGTLTSRGARLDSLTLFDMFPETHHSETLAIVDCD